MSKSFAVVLDNKARRWLNEHPSQDALVIAYEDSRCCGGGHIREVWLRRSRLRDESSLVDIGDVTGRRILLDRRIIPRMPHKIPVTVGASGHCADCTSTSPAKSGLDYCTTPCPSQHLESTGVIPFP